MPLIKTCEKEGIKLNKLGEVQWPEIENNCIKALKKKENIVKYGLMLYELDFGFEHRK